VFDVKNWCKKLKIWCVFWIDKSNMHIIDKNRLTCCPLKLSLNTCIMQANPNSMLRWVTIHEILDKTLFVCTIYVCQMTAAAFTHTFTMLPSNPCVYYQFIATSSILTKSCTVTEGSRLYTCRTHIRIPLKGVQT
jgi:hypothetical protein